MPRGRSSLVRVAHPWSNSYCLLSGRTTNNLLAASKHALETGEVELAPVWDLHEQTIEALGLGETEQAAEIRKLLETCERTLSGVALLGELCAIATRIQTWRHHRLHSARYATHHPYQPGLCTGGAGPPALRISSCRSASACRAGWWRHRRAGSRELVAPAGKERTKSAGSRSAQLGAIGIKSRQYESWDLGVVTSSDYGEVEGRGL